MKRGNRGSDSNAIIDAQSDGLNIMVKSRAICFSAADALCMRLYGIRGPVKLHRWVVNQCAPNLHCSALDARGSR